MTLAKFNVIAYRTVGIIIVIYLLLGGIGVALNGHYKSGCVGIVTALIIIRLLFKSPSLLFWLLMIILLFLAMFLVGGINSYEKNIHPKLVQIYNPGN